MIIVSLENIPWATTKEWLKRNNIKTRSIYDDDYFVPRAFLFFEEDMEATMFILTVGGKVIRKS